MDGMRFRPPAITLMCVEDEADARSFIVAMVSSAYDNMKVIVAENGEEGLELFNRFEPDIVLSDISMPRMDGIRMAEEIRKQAGRTEIIFMSAYSDAQFMLDAIKYGVCRYILKPIDTDLLFETIDQCIARINLERQVKAQNEFIRKLTRAVEQSPGVVVITDPLGTIQYVNPKFTVLTGYRRDEAIGKNPKILGSGLTPGCTYETLWETITGGHEWRGEFINRKKSGELYREQASISPVFDDDGSITHFVAVKEDVTELRRMMEQVELLNTDLAAKAAELEELNEQLQSSNADLEQANRELERSNVELEAFSHSASHDLRAPLANINAISQYLEECCSDRLDAQASEFLHLIRGEADRMMHLISSLLSFSRLQRHAMTVEELDLAPMAESIVAGLRLKEPQRQVAYTSAPTALVRGDRVLLHSVLENLLGNAWKYTGRTAHATIEFGIDDCCGSTIFFVRDNGAGFPMEQAAKLFAPFQRLHDSDDFEGNGVGLATVHRIIDRHGGKIWAEGEVGRGATFYFTLGLN